MYNNSSSSINIYIIKNKIKSVILQVLITMFLILNYQLMYDSLVFHDFLNQSLYKSSLKTHFYTLAFE